MGAARRQPRKPQEREDSQGGRDDGAPALGQEQGKSDDAQTDTCRQAGDAPCAQQREAGQKRGRKPAGAKDGVTRPSERHETVRENLLKQVRPT